MQIEKIEVHLIKSQLQRLIQYPYFKKEVKVHLEKLTGLCDDLLKSYPKFPSKVYLFIATRLWESIKFLSGSTINETPYEIVACLDKALADWYSQQNSITTALLPEKNYYFYSSDPQNDLKKICGIDLNLEIIQIALPKSYKHFPLYNVALYHELGHFIDLKFSISDYVLLAYEKQLGLTKDNFFVLRNHVKEYFADLFAASYSGNAVSIFLEKVIGLQKATSTHPDSSQRIVLVQNFIDSKNDPWIEMFQDACKKTAGNSLEIRYALPDINHCLNDFRPARIGTDAEMHGLFAAGWNFVLNPSVRDTDTWSKIEEFDAFSRVNDLITKTIRNYVIVDKWNSSEKTG
jgi:hypothetical protein